MIVKEALANGRLTPRNRSPEFQSKLAILEQQSQTRGTTIDALALAACLSQPFVDLVLSGAAQVAHLDSNLKALQVTWDDSLMDTLRFLREPAKVYWAKRSQLAWN